MQKTSKKESRAVQDSAKFAPSHNKGAHSLENLVGITVPY